jgi:pimeloyl-ACP methyl ester carboxylesterase
MASNRTTLFVYCGQKSTDPTLAARLAKIALPTLVIWGDSDGIVDVEYGRTWAAFIPGAKFELLSGAGHVPQIETPEKLLEAIWKV